jgi:aminopeptidase N
MVQALMGNTAFVRGLADYYAKYAFSNATTAEWIQCMAEAFPKDRQQVILALLLSPSFFSSARCLSLRL